MVRLLIGLAVAAVVFIVYAVVDCATMPRDRVRGISKTSWVFAILLLPVIGAALWFIIGRVRAVKAPPRGKAPDDDLEFLRKLDQERAQTKRIHDLEDELKRFDDDAPDTTPPAEPGRAQPGHAHPDHTHPDHTQPGRPAGPEGTEKPDDGPGRKPPGAPSAS